MQGNPISSTGHVLTLSMSGKDVLPLHAGETVTAEVISVDANNAVKIKVRNTVLDVQSEVPLQKGDLISLRVERQENMVYLRLAGSAAPEQAVSVKDAALSALGNYEKNEPGITGMTRLVDLLKLLPASIQNGLPEIAIVDRFLLEVGQLNGKALKDVVENGGVFFETKLRILALGMEAEGMNADIEAGRIIANDLKASLLRLKDTFLMSPAMLENVKNSVRPDELINALNTVLRNIEFYQLQSKLADSLQFFLPLVWQQLRDGEVILRESDRGKPGERSFSCTINLDLDGIGKLKVSLLLQAGYIHVNCAAESKAFSQVLREGADLLETQFKTSGLRLGNLSVHHQTTIDFRGPAAQGLSIRV